MNKQALVVLAALFAGLLLGPLAERVVPGVGLWAGVVGDMWLNGLKMTVIPLIVALLITGIVKAATMARAGRTTLRALVLMLGLLCLSAVTAAILTPALLAIFPVPVQSAEAFRSSMVGLEQIDDIPPFVEFLRALIPTNPVSAAAENAILPLIIFTLAFAFAITRLEAEKAAPLTDFFAALGDAMLILIGWVLALAPVGVFALALVVGAKAGSTVFGMLAHYVAIVSAVGAVFWAGSLAVAAIGARVGPLRFLRATLPAQAVAISTQSSLASLPAMLTGVRALGVGERSADIVLPIAVALFRVTGPCMNLAVAIYVAGIMGVELTAGALAAGVVVAAITTLGAVSLPGAVSFISSIAPIAIAMGLPVEPLALLVAIEAFPDIMRTLGNVTMDMAVTSTVARREGDFVE
jgi:proton glutamate symport protein